MNYQVDWIRFARIIMPSFLRKTVFVSWLTALLKPVIDLYDTFIVYTNRQIYLMSFRFQKASMEKLLNEEFNGGGGIYIEDVNVNIQPNFIFDNIDNQPTTFIYDNADNEAPHFIYDNADYYTSSYNYIIWVPVGVVFDELVMRALVNRYNHFPKTYSIQTY